MGSGDGKGGKSTDAIGERAEVDRSGVAGWARSRIEDKSLLCGATGFSKFIVALFANRNALR